MWPGSRSGYTKIFANYWPKILCSGTVAIFWELLFAIHRNMYIASVVAPSSGLMYLTYVVHNSRERCLNPHHPGSLTRSLSPVTMGHDTLFIRTRNLTLLIRLASRASAHTKNTKEAKQYTLLPPHPHTTLYSHCHVHPFPQQESNLLS